MTTARGSSRRRIRTNASTRSSGWPTACPAESSTARSARRATRFPTSRWTRPPPRCRRRWVTRRPPGSPSLREAAAAWIARRFGVEVTRDEIGACVGTKEFVAALPHLLRLRTPGARHRAVSRGRVPDVRDGCDPRRLPCGSRSPSTPTGISISSAISEADAARALVLWVNEPGNPTGSVGDARVVPRDRGMGARARHRRRERRVLRRVRARARVDPHRRPARRPRACTACRSVRTWPACAAASTQVTRSW